MKRLILDIETAPNKVYSWGLFNQNIAINQIDEPGYILCWGAKWHGKDKVHFASLKQHGKHEMLNRIYELLDEADALIHYNGQRFDIPTLNQEFLSEGWVMPSPSIHIDLLKTARKQFRLPSNKLAYVAHYLKLGEKPASFNMELWKACMRGEAKAWKSMKEYNINDVLLTERVYDKLLPWISNHPNYALFHGAEEMSCTTCGSHRLQKRGMTQTKTLKYQRYQCQDCGTWMRSRVSEKTGNRSKLVGI